MLLNAEGDAVPVVPEVYLRKSRRICLQKYSSFVQRMNT